MRFDTGMPVVNRRSIIKVCHINHFYHSSDKGAGERVHDEDHRPTLRREGGGAYREGWTVKNTVHGAGSIRDLAKSLYRVPNE